MRALPAEQWAEVRVRDHVIRYRRAGRGRLILVLLAQQPPLWPGLLDALAEAFRVFHPEPPPEPEDHEGWLDALLDGLGMQGITLLATESFLGAVQASAQRDDVAALILLADQPVDQTTPTLLLDRSLDSDEARARIERFLALTAPNTPQPKSSGT